MQKQDNYDPEEITLKWQAKWEQDKLYHLDLNSAKQPYYCLMMFPYPSAEGLHIGSIYTFTGVDAFARFKRMQGFNVFEPFGLDAFGIHSENYALKIGTHPLEQSKITEENFYRQMHATGNMIDWSHRLETTDPNYYKWTQWLFIQMFKHGLAERKKAKVNFCPSCKTVLADEQVIDGKCERCGSIVEKRDLEQWFFKITKYADRLLKNIPELNWAEKVKTAQTNWIGKKEGIDITYHVVDSEGKSFNDQVIIVFTTRPETNFGATFIALAPEHDIVNKILNDEYPLSSKTKKVIRDYIKSIENRSDIERQAEGREKTGVFTGLYAINHLTGYHMPIWISDFVLMNFGTGALVGVPGHDKRDFEFAKKFGLEIKRVVVGSDGDASNIESIEQVQEDEGNMIHSDFLDGLDIHKATTKIIDYLQEKGYGKRSSTYHLRDWLISRQRYWGPPIPLIYCEKCAKEGKSWFTTTEAKQMTNDQYPMSSKAADLRSEMQDLTSSATGWYPVPEDQLPILLPNIEDFKPLGTGKAPLANHPEFYETTCPECGSKAKRETDVSDTFLDSAWYFLRYLSTDIENEAFDIDRSNRWLPVTVYIGGAEHSVLHLLYARFVTMFLHDLGLLNFEEPFSWFYAHGLIIKDGAKMSKSKGNVVLPDPLIQKFGIDTVRMYLRFLGPFSEGGDFRDTGIEGMHRFVKRIWNIFSTFKTPNFINQLSNESQRMMHQTIKGVTEDMQELRFNTAVAKIMTYYNFLSDQNEINVEEAKVFLQLIAPFMPHLAEELWSKIGQPYSIHNSSWPTYDPAALQSDTLKIVVQINGKVRDMLEASRKASKNQDIVEQQSKELKRIKEQLAGKEVAKVIYIPGKVINFVVNPL